MKTAAYNASTDSFTFGARQTGTDSGIADTAQLTASDIKTTVKPADGAYGEFLRVDFNGNGYGALGSRMNISPVAKIARILFRSRRFSIYIINVSRISSDLNDFPRYSAIYAVTTSPSSFSTSSFTRNV